MRPDQAKPLQDRIRANIRVTSDGCWLWQLSLRNGYGRLWVGSRVDGTRRLVGAHRVSYEVFVGPIPTGLHLDHLCRHPSCVNPAHLEPVTVRENVVVRGVGQDGPGEKSKRTHCKRGHPFDATNTYINKGKRYCRTCARSRLAAYRAEKAV